MRLPLFGVLLAFLSLAVPTAPQPFQSGLPEVLQLHGYPYGKTQYNSAAEWLSGPPISGQNHLSPANPMGTLGHTHLECWAPMYGEVPHGVFKLPCQAQLFHAAGMVTIEINNTIVKAIDYDTPGPMIGDPMGVKLWKFTITVDTAKEFYDGNGVVVKTPENGWFHVGFWAKTYMDNDAVMATPILIPLYAKGNPMVPESDKHFLISARGGASTLLSGSAHGTPFSEFKDVYIPIPSAPIAVPVDVLANSEVYARDTKWPNIAGDRMQSYLDMDLHNGNPGILLTELVGEAAKKVQFLFRFPTNFGDGPHKAANIWCQNSGVGSPVIGPNEEQCSLLVTPFTVNTMTGWRPVTSPDGVSITTSAQWLTDKFGHIYHLMGNRTMRSDAGHYGSGLGSEIQLCHGEGRVLGTDANWYAAVGDHWENIGPLVCPDLTTPPDPVTPPPTLPESAEGTRILPGSGEVVDAAGVTFRIDGVTLLPQSRGAGSSTWGNIGDRVTEGSYCGHTFRVKADQWYAWTTPAGFVAAGPTDVCGMPPPPVDCAGVKGTPVQQSATLWLIPFTVTTQPANGGKSCALVAGGG